MTRLMWFRLIVLLGVLSTFIFTMKTMIWGALTFFATVSLLAAIASTIDKVFYTKKTGSRLFVWFLNQPLLIELTGITIAFITGGTGTITGIMHGISAGVMAALMRWTNTAYKHFNTRKSLVDTIYEEYLPKDFEPGESLYSAMGFPKFRKVKVETVNNK